MKNDDLVFDTLLTLASADTRADELAAFDALDVAASAPGLVEPPLPTLTPARHPRRRMFTVAAVAAAAMLFAVGAVAAWPTLNLSFENGKAYLWVENVPEEGTFHQMEFGYLPEGWAVTWTDYEPEWEEYLARVSYRQKDVSDAQRTVTKSFLIVQRRMADTVRVIENADGTPFSEEDQKRVEEVYTLIDSPNSLVWNDIAENVCMLWTTTNSVYTYNREFGSLFDIAEGEEIIKVLQNITP